MTDLINIQIPNTIMGLGAISKIGDVVRKFAPTNILIVTDKGIIKAGIIDAVKSPLEKAGCKFDIFDGCQAEAPSGVIEELSHKIKLGKYDLLIGFGGGSVMDTTKAASITAANDISVDDLINGKFGERTIAKILVPTTAGTGSEWSHVALVADEKAGRQKKTVRTVQNFADAAIVDPELTLNLPQRITADTGMDALTHGIEAYGSPNANVISDMLAGTALKMIADNLRLAYVRGHKDIKARYNLSIAASLAMHAVVLTGVGLVHFMGESLETKAHISHGSSITILLPHIMEFNLVANLTKFTKIAELMGERIDGLSVLDAAAKSVSAVKRLARDLEMPQKLSDVGISEADIPLMVEEIHTSRGALLNQRNPRDVGREDITRLFRIAL